jgi:hypothetical protein
MRRPKDRQPIMALRCFSLSRGGLSDIRCHPVPFHEIPNKTTPLGEHYR